MKILFVQAAAGFQMRGTTYPVCRSIMTTASYMKSIGNEVLVHDRCIDFRKFEKVSNSFKPDLVMVYVPPTGSFKDAMAVSSFVSEKNVTVVWAEVVACVLAEYIIENDLADFVIMGETEIKLEMLIKELSGGENYESIPGLVYKRSGEVVSNKNQNNTPLDKIPAIDWEMIDVEKCFRKFPHCKKMLYLYTSRGCPNRCAFCWTTMFYNSEYRKRPLHFVLNEIKHLEQNHGLDGVNFSDEFLWLNDKEIEEIAEFRRNNGLKFVWGAQTRADAYNSIEVLQKMYDAGCRWFLLGIETGSEETRKRINKPMDKTLIKEFVDKCTQVGITTFGSFIIGFPGENSEQVKETAEFAQSLNLDAFLFNFYTLVPKTPLCDKLVSDGLIDISKLAEGTKTGQETQSLTKNYSEISEKDLRVIKSWFDWLTFTRKKPESTQKSMFIEKSLDTLKHFMQGNLKESVANVFDAGVAFLTIVFYANCFPKIKKKYGLRNVNKKSKNK